MRTEVIGDATLVLGDSRDALKDMADNSIDAVVCDPPYALDTISKRFSSATAAPAQYGKDGAYARLSAGFMGKDWDSADTAFDPAFWGEVYRVLKPGGHVLAASGTRTYGFLFMAIWMAGFEIRDMVSWLYGSGFPKSHDVSKGIDKAAGAEREVVGSKLGLPGYHLLGHEGGEAFGHGLSSYTPETRLASSQVTAPTTPEAAQWVGWGTALKPACEPWVLARKPLEGTVAANVLAHGTGALNINGCRVAYDMGDTNPATNPLHRKNAGYANGNASDAGSSSYSLKDGSGDRNPSDLGRWPANVIHDGSDEVLARFPGAESRFFYAAKASKKDREEGNGHPTVKPTDLMRYLCRLITPPGGLILDPFAGSGSTGKAALAEGFRFIGVEREAEYFEIAKARLERASQRPTQGNLAL